MNKTPCPPCVKGHRRCTHPYRPDNDPRNNFTVPTGNPKGPKRDLLVSPLRISVIDIETTGLDASFGRVLCGVSTFFSPDETRIRRADEYDSWNTRRRSSDKGLVEAILRDVEEADIIVAHNGTYFDMPFLRTRAIIHGLQPVNPKKILDPVMLARKVFRFHRNSLEALSNVLGTEDMKTKLSPRVWVKAMFDGDKEALDEIVEHCIADVRVLCEVAKKMAPYIKQLDAVGSWRQ